uniref:SRCR domain-containing protein n=1 Tax=Acanthochromis polyacanthus TaxID=80966 RepID=A0A3Q1EPS4_9TELE
MHCGTADNFTSTPRADQEVWSHSYNCSRSETSLFECDNTEISSNVSQNASIASVNCSGTIKLKLTKCWGNVNMFMEGKSGGICADTWTEDNSEMLCKEQGCGSKVLKSFNQQSQTEIMVHSLHAMQPNAKLNQYNFIMNDQGRTCQKPASVVCSGSVKPRFSDSIDSCSGKLELSYEEKWLPVCREALKEQKAQNAICRRLNCGVAFGATDDFGPTPLSNQVITAIQCSNNNAASLKECEVTSEFRSCTLGVLKCSKWKTMVLEHEPCKGEVAVYSANEVSAVSSQGWTMNESQRLCQDMACGSPISFGGNGTWPTDSFFNGTFNCKGGKQQSIWDCEKKVPPSEKKKLFIECQSKTSTTV